MKRFVLVLVVALVLENAQTGWDVEDENEEEDARIGSWKALLIERTTTALFPAPGTTLNYSIP